MRPIGRLPRLMRALWTLAPFLLACVSAAADRAIPEVTVGPLMPESRGPEKTETASAADRLVFAGSRLRDTEKRSLGTLTAAERERLASRSERDRRTLRATVGISRRLEPAVRFSIDAKQTTSASTEQTQSNGLLRVEKDGRASWTTGVRSSGARGIRLFFSKARLPRGAKIYVYSAAGEVHGPYAFDAGFPAEGFWTHEVFADQAFLEIQLGSMAPGGDFELVVSTIGHMESPAPAGLLAKEADVCFTDASCPNPEFSGQALAEGATAELIFETDSIFYVCTGTLLNDTLNSRTPYLLTANHCISDQPTALSLEAIWGFRTATCNGAFPDESQFPSTLGATLLATGPQSDFTLLRLSETPPAGSAWLGWTTTDYSTADTLALYRISHPLQDPQGLSGHAITSNPKVRCQLIGNFLFTEFVFGQTSPGSSGSAACLADGTVVGQLFEKCGPNLNDCSSANYRVDGAFRVSYSSLAEWLSPQGVPPVAAFTFSPLNPPPGQPVSFVDGSTGTPSSWSWDFGDGTVSSSPNPTKSYASPGTFTVSLTVGNASGSSSTTRTVTVGAGGAAPCVSGINTLCLNGGRFGVTATYQSATTSGMGNAVPLTSDTGYFWFFSSNNVEMVAKVVNGCAFNDRYWIFAGGLTNVAVNIIVTDTQTGISRTYANPANTAFQPIQDTAALPTCP